MTRARAIIAGVLPQVDAGHYPVKRLAGDVLHISADVFADGHDLIAAIALLRGPGEVEFLDWCERSRERQFRARRARRV